MEMRLRIIFPHGYEIQKMYLPLRKVYIEDGRSTQEFNPTHLHIKGMFSSWLAFKSAGAGLNGFAPGS